MTDLASPAELLDLTGRVIVVTGAGGGLGSGITRRMRSAGATVVAVTRSSPVDDPSMTVVAADLTTTDGPAGVIEATLAAHGRIDGLVNNAGIQPVVPFADVTDQQWAEMMDTNLTAT
ncbi:MAG: SDR family NAD(P)-dependent oxidoreductase, partial [Acidimicrobiia bacterium]